MTLQLALMVMLLRAKGSASLLTLGAAGTEFSTQYQVGTYGLYVRNIMI